jgi:hypothetical protein
MAKELWLDAILMHKSMVLAFKVDVDIGTGSSGATH